MKKQNQKVIRTFSLLRLMLNGTKYLLVRVSSVIGGGGGVWKAYFPFFGDNRKGRLGFLL